MNKITLKSGRLKVNIEGDRIWVTGRSGEKVLTSSGAVDIADVPGRRARLLFSWYRLKNRPRNMVAPNIVISKKIQKKSASISIGRGESGPPVAEVRVELIKPDVVRYCYSFLGPNRSMSVRQWFESHPEEQFYGFGERQNSAGQRGQIVPVWTEEKAAGLGEFIGRHLPNLRFNPFPTGPTSTYCPMPLFLSNRGYGILLTGSHRSVFDLCHTDPTRFGVEIWNHKLEWLLFYGPEPLDVIERMTEYTGRIKLPTPWVFAPWNDAVTGASRVRKVAKTLREEKIPSSAIWTEDWQGGWDLFRNYFVFPVVFEPGRGLYPDIEKLAEELHSDGFRFLSYFFPYVLKSHPLFKEGERGGFFIKDKSGRTILLSVIGSNYGQVDLTNKGARDWLKGIFRKNLALGFDGWMADFGEYASPHGRFANGCDGWEMHNKYPLLWQEINREFFEEERPDGDFVFFCRSGYTGTQKYAPVSWAGDQNTSFEKDDGLPSVVPAALSAGISGIAIWSSDIAGYKSILCSPSDLELFFRWTQFGAFCPVMRTHHGVRARYNWSFDRDSETIEQYRIYARWHTALFPYIYSYARIAEKVGHPIMRHLALHYPTDPRVRDIDDEYLFGEWILVAPVLNRGARKRIVYLPKGTWVDYWSGSRHRGGDEFEVDAPLKKIPLFIKDGGIIPTYDTYADTLILSRRDKKLAKDIRIFPDIDKSIRITAYGLNSSSFRLWDGTEISITLRDGRNIRPGQSIKTRINLEKGRAVPYVNDEMSPIPGGNLFFKPFSISGREVSFALYSGRKVILMARVKGAPHSRRYTFMWR